ncbi:MAG: tetratricopeptide repeat protein, partial [bacterium]|nr:tetratricopeptide repeat protein [bacterium]
ERETGLLVRLYTKVGDPVSASEIIDEYLRTSGGDQVDALKEKARVYLSCTDFYHYERTVEDLIELDPDGKPDYLRQMAMSQLERGKPEDARDVLRQLKDLEGEGTDAAEFEAGVLALAGLRDDAILAYQKGIAGDPNRIESWLLLGNLLKETGQTQRAIRIFQHLAETAAKDDLFTIAIDGLLNLEAPASTLSWARRITLERIAGRNDKAYLYQLVADLAEAANDDKGVLIALESSLSIAGERRSSILRELVDRAAGSQDVWSRGRGGNKKKHLAFSRRLVGLGEIVPPDVFLNLGEVFLEADDPTSALRTFRMATDLPDQGAFNRQTGSIFESAGYPEEALSTYQRVLVSEPTSAGLLVKIAEMHERLGDSATAVELYLRGTELQLSRQPASSTKAEKASTQSGSRSWWGARNVDDFDRYFQRNLTGVLSVLSLEAGQKLAAEQLEMVIYELEKELADMEPTEPADDGEEAPKETFNRFPRSFHRAGLVRRLAFAFGVPHIAHKLDLTLLDHFFPDDKEMLPRLVRSRLTGGYVASARMLLDATQRSKEEITPLRFLVGQGAEEELPKQVTVEETMRLILPLIIDGKTGDAAVLLGRTNIAKDAAEAHVQALMAASLHIKNPDLSLRFGRQWLLLIFNSGASPWRMRPVLEKLEQILGPKEFRGICMLLAGKATEDPEKGQALLEMLPDLQEKFEEPLISDEELRDLIDAKDDLGWGWGLGPVILLLPEEQRVSALRSALPRINATARAGFMMMMLTESKLPLGSPLTEYFAEAFPEALQEADMKLLSFRFMGLAALETNHEAALAVCGAVLETDPEQFNARGARLALLEKLGRLEEALALAPADWKACNNNPDWQARNTQRAVEELLIEHNFDTLLLCLDENPGDDPQTDLITRVNLLSRNDRSEQALELLGSALEEDPEHMPFWKAMLRLRVAAKDHAEIITCHERIIELEPEERSHQERLMNYWLRQDNPIEALALKENLPPKDEDDEDSSGIPGLPPGLILPPGTTIVINGVTHTAGGSKSKRNEQPSMKRVKELAEGGDEEAAATMLRRLWRAFPEGISGRDRYGRISASNSTGNVPNWAWPADEKKEDEEKEEEDEVKPFRGGFDRYKEYTKPEEKPRVSSYQHLAEYDFGIEEMEHLLRTRNTRALNSSSARELMSGLLKHRISLSSPSQVRDGLLAELQANQAGKVQHAMLLQLFDDHSELLDEESSKILEDLARTLQTTDLGPLRKLAQLHARRGTTESAMRIYSWCATKVQPVSRFFFGEQSGVQLDAKDLLDEVRETLTGEALLTVTEEILFAATSSSDQWDRGRTDLFVLQTWKDMVPAEEALRRCAPVLDPLSTTKFDEAPARGLAKEAIELYLLVGDTERALTCFEIALAKFDRSLFVGIQYLWPNPESPGRLSHIDLKTLFPVDSSAYPAARDWCVGCAKLLAEWQAEERFDVANAARFSAFAALRLTEMGEMQAALDIIEPALAWEDLRPHSALYLVDAARAAGAEELATKVERKLFDERELLLGRVPDVLSMVQASAGPEAALALGEERIQYTQNKGLLSAVISAAEAAGKVERLGELRDLETRATAARARLKEIREAEIAAAKAKAEADK